MIQSDLFKRCRDARRAGRFTRALTVELMQACGRPLVAYELAQSGDPEELVPMKLTGLEYFIKEAKAHRARLARGRK